RLERGPRLAPRDDHVDLAGGDGEEVGRADPGQDRTGPVLEDDDRRVPAAAVLEARDGVPDLRLQLLLQRQVERRAPGAGGRDVAFGPEQELRGEVRREEVRGRSARADRLLAGSGDVLRPGVAERGHALHYLLTALPGADRVDERVVPRRRAGEPGEERGLAEAQVPGRPAEVEPRRRLDAHGALAERHPVQVLLEDRRLVEMGL